MIRLAEIEDLLGKIFDEYEDCVQVTVGAKVIEDEFDDPEEVYMARVNLDGEICGVISRDGITDALEQAVNKILNAGYGPVDMRHIRSFKDALDELGFDRSVALLENLK